MLLFPLFAFSPGRALLALLALALTIATCVYGRRYFEGAGERRFFMYGSLGFLLSVWGTLFSAQWITFAVFMEISTAALFSLIALKEREVALRYFVVQLVGAAFLLAGIGAAFVGHGTVFVGPVPEDALPFFILGLGVKAALPVLHFWLPEVHGRAPAPVSALLSGMAVKIGAFGLLQALGADGPNFLAPVGAMMALWGVALALAQHDMKRLLAYHTVSQLGYVIAAVGAGNPLGWCGALYHMTAHGLFKGMLFLCAGVVEKVYGTRELDRLGGAWKTLPFTCALYLVAAAAIAGLPGTIGFASKSLVKSALSEHPMVSLALLVANVGTVMSFCKMGWFAFGGSGKTAAQHCPGVRAMNAALVPLAVPVLLFGFFPGWIPRFLGASEPAFFSAAKCGESVLVLFVGVLFFFLLRSILKPAEKTIPDADLLFAATKCAVGKTIVLVRRLQGGNLREYIFFSVLAILMLVLLL